MEIANILPCNEIHSEMLRQPIEMYLTHKVLEHPEKFEFLGKDKERRVESYKILDNSACELGEGLDFDLVLRAAEIIDADEIVLPDIPRSGKSLTRTLQYWLDLPSDVREKYKIAAVCQGENEDQVLACAEQILCLSIDTIMLPKWYCGMNSENGLGRHDLTKQIITMRRVLDRRDVEIHWLGLDTGLRELVTPLMDEVRSVDTGYLAALSTPEWSHLHVTAERPRELKIDLEYMNVDINRWKQLVKQANQLMEG